jgi:hypothetical protein
MTDEPWEDATDDSGQFALERDGPAWERDGSGAGSFLATVKGVLLAPTQTFQTMRRDGGLGTPFLFGLLGGTIGVWASVVYQAVLLMISGEIGAFGVLMGTAIGGPIAIIVVMFIAAGIYHLMLMVLGSGQRGFETTFRVEAYAVGTVGLFSLIPVCGGLIGGIWGLVVVIIGLAEAHEISRGKAAAAVLIPWALCCLGIGVLIATGAMLIPRIG